MGIIEWKFIYILLDLTTNSHEKCNYLGPWQESNLWTYSTLHFPSGGARSRNLGGHLRGKLIFWGGKIEFLKRYCYTATGGRIS